MVQVSDRDYLLGIDCSLHLGKIGLWIYSPQEDGLELIHSGIGKEQRGICMRDHAAAGHSCMAFALEELNESRANTISCTDSDLNDINCDCCHTSSEGMKLQIMSLANVIDAYNQAISAMRLYHLVPKSVFCEHGSVYQTRAPPCGHLAHGREAVKILSMRGPDEYAASRGSQIALCTFKRHEPGLARTTLGDGPCTRESPPFVQ